ncbi:MAG: PEP-CTERM system TPR-repeat protein PrsT [Burkholderiales bacterium]|nr:MAG: PEP-CTERM system TPR-repeat protein PrsT [Burkholderiales bacterium]
MIQDVQPSKARLHKVVSVVAVCLSLWACSDQNATTYIATGKAKMANKEYRAAVIEFKNALQKDANSSEARFLLGKALLEIGDAPGALVELRKLQDTGFDKETLTPVLAAALVFNGEFDRFIAEYADVELKTPSLQAELKSALAAAYGAKGKYVQSRVAAEAALQADPNNLAAQLALVQLLLVAEDRGGALEQVERAIKTHPNASRPWIVKAEVQRTLGVDVAQVIESYRQALKVDSSAVPAHIGITDILIRQQDYEGARKELADAKKIDPNSVEVQYYTALMAVQQNDLKLAQDLVLQLLKVAPGNPRFLQLAGLVEYERGRYLEAMAHLGKALNSTRAPGAVRVLLAKAQMRAGDPRKAYSTLQPLLDTPGTQPSEVYSVAGEALQQQGRMDEARRLFAQAVKSNPKDARGRTALALAQIDEGRDEQGVKELRAIASSDEGMIADVALIAAHIKANRMAEAEAAVAALDKKAPTKPMPAFYMGRLAQLRGQNGVAREKFELALKRQPTYMPAANALAALDIQDKKPEAAIARFEKIAAADPGLVDARLAVVLVRQRTGASRAALIELLDPIIKQFPGTDEPLLAKIQLLLGSDNKAAAQLASEGVSRFPEKGLFLDLLGQAEMLQGHHTAALQAFNKLAAMDPNAVNPMMRIAEVYLARNDAPAATSQLRKVLTVKPDFPQAQAMLVVLLARTNKIDEAFTLVRGIQTRTPNDARAWIFEGDLHNTKGNLPAAITAYRTSLKKRESSDATVKLHRSLLAAGQGAEASKIEDDWLKRHPEDPLFQFYLGDIALANGQFERAESLYRKVVTLVPDNAVAINNIAWTLLRQGKPGARALAEQALALAPDSTAILDTLAEIHASEGRLDQALTVQKRALELDPQQHVHRLHLAQFLVKANQKAAARVELQKLSDLGKAFPRQDEVQKLLGSL